jgi:hypothetical protein
VAMRRRIERSVATKASPSQSAASAKMSVMAAPRTLAYEAPRLGLTVGIISRRAPAVRGGMPSPCD